MRDPNLRASPGRQEAWRVSGALLLVQLLFGLHYPAAKLLLLEFNPRAWALLRVSAAGVLLLVATLWLRKPLPRDWRVLGRLALFSLFGVVINQWCFVEGLARTSASHSAVLNTTIPIWTLILAAVLGRETFRVWKLLPFGLALGGILLVLHPATRGLPEGARWGDVLTLANALSYAVFLVLAKRVLTCTNALAASALLFIFGALWMLAPGLPALLALHPGEVSWMGWGLGLFIVIFPTAGAYALTCWALGRAKSTVVAFFIFLQPVIAASLSMVVLGEQPSSNFLLGALLIFVAVGLTLRLQLLPGSARRASSSAPRGRTDSSKSNSGE